MTMATSTWARNAQLCQMPLVTVRPLCATDGALLYAMHERLSHATIYARYLQYRHPCREEVAALATVSPARGYGIVATVDLDEDTPQVVGLTYYLRDHAHAAASAEVGMLVEDTYQGVGIGRLLASAIIQQARAQSVDELRARFHPGNRRVLRLIQASGCTYHASVKDGLNEFTLHLYEGAPPAAQ